MATLEYWQQKEKEAKDELDKANAALETFNEGEDEGLQLKKLRRRRKELDEEDKKEKDRLEGEEARLIKAVEECRGEWVKSKEDLRQARTQTGNDFVTRALGT